MNLWRSTQNLRSLSICPSTQVPATFFLQVHASRFSSWTAGGPALLFVLG